MADHCPAFLFLCACVYEVALLLKKGCHCTSTARFTVQFAINYVTYTVLYKQKEFLHIIKKKRIQYSDNVQLCCAICIRVVKWNLCNISNMVWSQSDQYVGSSNTVVEYFCIIDWARIGVLICMCENCPVQLWLLGGCFVLIDLQEYARCLVQKIDGFGVQAVP